MATFTPTATSSAIAGGGFWLTCWALLFKSNTFARGRDVRGASLDWIAKHPVETIVLTEVINYAIHGVTSPISVMAAIGGTIINVLMVGGIKIQRWLRGKRRLAV